MAMSKGFVKYRAEKPPAPSDVFHGFERLNYLDFAGYINMEYNNGFMEGFKAAADLLWQNFREIGSWQSLDGYMWRKEHKAMEDHSRQAFAELREAAE